MDVPQLKLLAGRVRGLLDQSSAHVGHSQSLDLVAALPGLRNWPEVLAFPERVAACEIDVTSAARLAFRLKKNFAMELTPNDVLSALAPNSFGTSQGVLQVWPGGPPSGVYVTTSAQAISALLARYEDATDGGLVYAERAGSGWEGSIDLGEYGLWSPGIERLPTGTLLVVGEIDLDQQSWQEAAGRLEIACLHALNSAHRVAVLVDTPTPHTLFQDLNVLLRSAADEHSDTATALVGVVADDGTLQRRLPFATAYPKPVLSRSNVGLEALPVSTRGALSQELAKRTSGIVLFGSPELVEHPASDQLAAVLALTEHAGPAARVMPRHRSTPDKDWLVPDAIKVLPFLPSVESGYAQGYRRMVIDARYSKRVLRRYDDVLFLGCTHEHNVATIALSLLSHDGRHDARVMERIVALLGVLKMPGKHGEVVVSDLFLRSRASGPCGENYEQFKSFLEANRVVRWEEELAPFLDTGDVSAAAARKASRESLAVREFLVRRRTSRSVEPQRLAPALQTPTFRVAEDAAGSKGSI